MPKPSELVRGLMRSSQLFDQRQVYEFGRWLDNLHGQTETVTRAVGELSAVAWPHHRHIEQHIDETKYVVVDSAGLGDYTTLQAALTATAAAGADAEKWTIIYRTPTTENISFAPGSGKPDLAVHIWALGGATLTGRVDGDVYGKLHLHNMVISYNSNDNSKTVTSANGNSLYLYGCTISRTHLTAPENVVIGPAGGTVYLYNCTVFQEVNSNYSVFYGAGEVYAYNCKIDALGGRGIGEANAGAAYYFYHCVLTGATGNLFNTAGGGNVYLARCQFDTMIGGTYTILDGDVPPPDAGSITPAMLQNASSQYRLLTSGATPFAYAESGYLLDGTAGGKTVLAVTSGKTLTLTAADDYNVTIPATGTAALLGTANVFTQPQVIKSDTSPQISIRGGTNNNKHFDFGFNTTTNIATIDALEDTVGYRSINIAPTGNNKVSIGPTPAGATAALAVAQNATAGATQLIIYGATNNNHQLFIGFDTTNNYATFEAITQGVAFRNIYLNPTGGSNVGIGAASAVARLTVLNTTNIQGLLVTGHTTQAVATPLVQFTRNDAAAGVSALLGLTALGSGANGDGGSILLAGKSSTTAAQSMGALKWLWASATHASRKAKIQISTYDTAERIGLAIEADGAAQDVYFEGGAGSGLPYGSCYGNDIGWSQASAAQNTWYEISDADIVDGHGGLNLVAHDGSGKLTVSKAGRYPIAYNLVAGCSVANKQIQSGISINGTEIGDGIDHETSGAISEQLKLGSHALVALAANDTVEISIRTTDAGDPDLSVEHINIVIGQVGG